MRGWVAVVGLMASLAGCIEHHPPAGPYQCSDAGDCLDGWHCSAGGDTAVPICVEGPPPEDDAGPGDAAATDTGRS